MLSMTQTDAPRISLATPEDVKAVSEQALNIWTGALSPLWLPFWAASTVGIGLWGLGQSFKRALGGAALEGDTALLSKWPGFALSLPTPATKAVEAVVAEAVVEAPKAAVKAAKKVVEAAEPVVAETAKVIEEAPQAVAEVAEKLAEPVVEAVEAAPEAIVESVEATADTVTETASDAVAATETFIDPVVETPVVPEAVEDIAEADLFKPLSAKIAPRRSKKK